MTRRDLRSADASWRSAAHRPCAYHKPWPKAERTGFWARLLRLIGL